MSATRNVLVERKLAFRSPALSGWQWLVQDISGQSAGPRLCVMSGVHVNEVSCIEAVFRLREAFLQTPLKGSVSLMPLANPPALPGRCEYICPVDGKNINFTFPGSPEGTFSEALCDALLNEWADDADCLVDLHGGDLCEEVAHFTVAPTIGDADFDAFNLQLAQAFDPQIVVTLPPTQLEQPGRSCSGRARQRRHAAFAEAGAHGLVDETSVRFHVNGVLRIAHLLGMIPEAPPTSSTPYLADEYHWVQSRVEGWFRPAVEAGVSVEKNQTIATIHDYSGQMLQEVISPATGFILWRWTHASVLVNGSLFGIAARSGHVPEHQARAT